MQAGWELIVGVSVFSVISSDPTFTRLLVLCLAVVGAAYTILGGLRGNLRANEAQNALKVLTVGVIIWQLAAHLNAPVSMAGSTTITQHQGAFDTFVGTHKRLLTSLGVGGFITNAFFSLAWQFVDMSAWQNLAATDEEKPRILEKTLLSSAFWVFLFPGVFGTVIGILLSGRPGLTSDNIVAQIVKDVVQSPWLVFLLTAGFVAAMLSTIDGLLLAAGQAATWDIAQPAQVNKAFKFWKAQDNETARDLLSDYSGKVPADVKFAERSVLAGTRLSIILLALTGAGLLLLLQGQNVSLFNLVYFITVAQMSLAPTVLSCLTGWRQERGSGFLSIVSGLSVGFSLAAVGQLAQHPDLLTWSPVVGAAAAALTLAFVNRREYEVTAP